jgi:hypothetical protein
MWLDLPQNLRAKDPWPEARQSRTEMMHNNRRPSSGFDASNGSR